MKNLEPVVSVIISTYNRAQFLIKAIESVLNQTFQSFELIIVDDGSTDETEKIVKEFQKKDKRIKYILLEENSGGPSKPKNIGIDISSGKYLAFLDDDDEWFPEKLEKQLDIFKNNNNLTLVACNSLDVYEEKGTIKKYKIKKRKDYFVAILESCFIHSSSSVIVKKDALNNVGFFDENLKIGEDWDMWIRILSQYHFSFTEEPLFKYHIHNKNISQKLCEKDSIGDHLSIFNKHKKHYLNNHKIYSNKLRYDGTRYMLSSQVKNAQKAFLKSIKINPLNLKSYLYFFISFLGIKIYKNLNFLKSKIR